MLLSVLVFVRHYISYAFSEVLVNLKNGKKRYALKGEYQTVIKILWCGVLVVSVVIHQVADGSPRFNLENFSNQASADVKTKNL